MWEIKEKKEKEKTIMGGLGEWGGWASPPHNPHRSVRHGARQRGVSARRWGLWRGAPPPPGDLLSVPTTLGGARLFHYFPYFTRVSASGQVSVECGFVIFRGH